MFTHQRKTSFLNCSFSCGQMSITVAEGMGGPDWSTSGQCPSLSTNECPEEATRSSKTRWTPAIVTWKWGGGRCQEDGMTTGQTAIPILQMRKLSLPEQQEFS